MTAESAESSSGLFGKKEKLQFLHIALFCLRIMQERPDRPGFTGILSIRQMTQKRQYPSLQQISVPYMRSQPDSWSLTVPDQRKGCRQRYQRLEQRFFLFQIRHHGPVGSDHIPEQILPLQLMGQTGKGTSRSGYDLNSMLFCPFQPEESFIADPASGIQTGTVHIYCK